MFKSRMNSGILLLKQAIFAYRLKRDLRASNGHVVLVFQMAKVGSTSVYQSLRKSLKIPVYHVHHLSASGILGAEQFFRNAGAPVPSNIRYAAILRNQLAGMHPVIVTLVRDPIAREISNYFQIGDRCFEALKGVDRREGSKRLEAVVSELSVRIGNLRDEERSVVHTWFDNELKSVFGVDVYSRPFDFGNGFSVFSGEQCEVLLFRLEDLNRSFQNGVRQVFGHHDNLNLSQRNTSDEKPYADLYREAKARIRVEPEIGEAIYATRFGRHFYGDMAEALIQKWSKAGN